MVKNDILTILIFCGANEDVDANGIGQDVQLELVDHGFLLAIVLWFVIVVIPGLQIVLTRQEQLLDEQLYFFDKRSRKT